MIFRQLGCDVHMLVRGKSNAALERIGIDRDIAATLLDSLRRGGVNIHEDTEVASFEVPDARSKPVVLKLKGDLPPMECDVFLAAIGYSPKTDGLDKLGIEVDPKFKNVKVNENFETSVSGVYAAGDIIGRP